MKSSPLKNSASESQNLSSNSKIPGTQSESIPNSDSEKNLKSNELDQGFTNLHAEKDNNLQEPTSTSSRPDAPGAAEDAQMKRDDQDTDGQEGGDEKSPSNKKSENSKDNISVNQLSELLDLKLNPLKTSISSLESQISGLESSMNSKISEITNSCNSQINSLKVGMNKDIQRIDSRMDSLARDIEDLQLQGGDILGSNNSSKNSKKILELEREILDLKNFWIEKDNIEKHAQVGVFGIGKEGGKEEAIAWLDEKLKLVSNCKAEIYTKGDFKGILFAKFDSKHARNRSIESFRKASLTRSGSRYWASEDAPVEDRARKSFLFGIKNL